jgi:hypothetical protein
MRRCPSRHLVRSKGQAKPYGRVCSQKSSCTWRVTAPGTLHGRPLNPPSDSPPLSLPTTGVLEVRQTALSARYRAALSLQRSASAAVVLVQAASRAAALAQSLASHPLRHHLPALAPATQPPSSPASTAAAPGSHPRLSTSETLYQFNAAAGACAGAGAASTLLLTAALVHVRRGQLYARFASPINAAVVATHAASQVGRVEAATPSILNT